MARKLKLFEDAFAKILEGFILAFPQRQGPSDIIGQARLPVVEPFSINTVIVTDENVLPMPGLL